MTISYLTDVEGRWDKLVSFTTGNPYVSLVDGELHLADGVTFVFGGDAIDRGAHGRRFVSLLLAAKRAYGERVILLAGNRDINKLRLVTELGGKPRAGAPADGTRAEILRWTLANTMGAAKAFEFRATELRELGEPADDEAVVDTCLSDLAPGGALRAFLNASRLGFRAGSTLILHGGVTPENFLKIPNAAPARDVDAWLAELDQFHRAELAKFESGQRPDALIAYQAQGPDKLNQASVVYARPTDELGNPQLPPLELRRFRDLPDGLSNIAMNTVGGLEEQFALRRRLDAVHRQDERMPHQFDALQRLELLLGADGIDVVGIQVAVDEFDRLQDAAGRDALPDLAEAARAERFDEAVAGQRFGVRLAEPTHTATRSPKFG